MDTVVLPDRIRPEYDARERHLLFAGAPTERELARRRPPIASPRERELEGGSDG